jgi:type IV secretory pathway TrbD component
MRSTPICLALSDVKTLGGVERTLAVLNTAIGLIATYWLWSVAVVVVPTFCAIHYVLVNVSKKEPRIFQIYIRYKDHASYYDPWPSALPSQTKRPDGFGNGELV